MPVLTLQVSPLFSGVHLAAYREAARTRVNVTLWEGEVHINISKPLSPPYAEALLQLTNDADGNDLDTFQHFANPDGTVLVISKPAPRHADIVNNLNLFTANLAEDKFQPPGDEPLREAWEALQHRTGRGVNVQDLGLYEAMLNKIQSDAPTPSTYPLGSQSVAEIQALLKKPLDKYKRHLQATGDAFRYAYPTGETAILSQEQTKLAAMVHKRLGQEI